jgi:hypothetical protein
MISICSSRVARASVVFSSDFSSGNRNGFFLARGTSGVTLSVQDDSAGIGTGNALDVSQSGAGTTSNRPIVAYFPLQTLNDGDTLTFSADTRLLGTVPSSDRRFRLGLYNSNGTQVTADTGTTVTTDDDNGYTTRNDVGTDSGNSTTMDIQQLISTGANKGVLAVDSAVAQSPDTNASMNDNLPHHFSFSIQRSGASLITTLTYSHDASTTVTVSGTDSAPPVTSFDELAFGQNGVALSYRIDNIQVSYTPAPEPGAIALISACGLIFGRRRIRPL